MHFLVLISDWIGTVTIPTKSSESVSPKHTYISFDGKLNLGYKSLQRSEDILVIHFSADFITAINTKISVVPRELSGWGGKEGKNSQHTAKHQQPPPQPPPHYLSTC